MNHAAPFSSPLPLLPLVLDNVPRGLRQALAQEGIPFVDRRPGEAEGRFVLFDSRTGACQTPAVGQIVIDVASLRDGFDEDPFIALVDQRSAGFQWQVAEFELVEEIARVDKRAVRRQLLDQLRQQIEQLGGIWLRIAAFPFPYRTALNFRLDYDHYDPADFATTLDALAGQEQATSHYVCGSAYESAPGALARLRGLDVGAHGFWHHTYQTVEENWQNIRRGIDVLQAARIEPSGFVAPNGRFNRSLLVALESLGIPYSSEFALAYDDLPFFVGTAGVLQIPIHPVCLELFVDAVKRGVPLASSEGLQRKAVAMEAAADYLVHVAQIKCDRREPVLLYGHPTGEAGGCAHVVRQVFHWAAGRSDLWRTSFGELNRWWRARGEVRIRVTSQDGEFSVQVLNGSPTYPVGIELCRGSQVAVLPLDRPVVQFSPEALVYDDRTAEPIVAPLKLDDPRGLRAQVRRLLDWEYVTPVDEILTNTWRNWAKRSLRRWWKR
jgi:hypothetical protein